MAWNPSPKVAVARDFGKRFEKQQVFIIALDRNKRTCEVISYGETKTLCDEAKKLGSAVHGEVFSAYEKVVNEAGWPDTREDGTCACGSGVIVGPCSACGREHGRVR